LSNRGGKGSSFSPGIYSPARRDASALANCGSSGQLPLSRNYFDIHLSGAHLHKK
jgi:hypothetical protein